MSKPLKVTHFERTMFAPHKPSVVPKATSEAEKSRRKEGKETGGAFQAGRRAEYHGLLRMVDVFKNIPITEHAAMRIATNVFSVALIGSGALGLHPEHTMGQEAASEDARMAKPARNPDLSSRDAWDPSQRPTSLDLLDMVIAKLEAATAMSNRLINYSGKTEEEIRQATIDLGRLEASVGLDLSCWNLADELSYGPYFPSAFETSHLVREKGMAQKRGAIALANQTGRIATVRDVGQEHNDFMNGMYNAGSAVLKDVLVRTEPLLLPT